jgi:secreted trypsin-like serine protease
MVRNRTRKIARVLAVAGAVVVASSLGLANAWAIYGGKTADEPYPFMTSVQFKSDKGLLHWCGGSVIDPLWVVTAKHCMGEYPPADIGDFRPAEPSDLAIRVGSRDRTSGGELVDVVKIVVHGKPLPTDPTEGGDGFGTDIALLKLSRPVQVEPVSLAAAPPNPQASPTVRLLGWGYNCKRPRHDQTCGELPTLLRQLDTTVLPASGCVSNDPNNSNITEREICQAPTAKGENTRAHDSGSPMLQKVNQRWTLVGLLSRPHVQSQTVDGPSIYTDATAYASWIRQQIDAP